MLYAKFGWNWSSGSEVEFKKNTLLLSPLEEGCGPLFVKIWIPSIQGCFVPNLDEIGFKERILKFFQYSFTISLLSFLWEGQGPSFE